VNRHGRFQESNLFQEIFEEIVARFFRANERRATAEADKRSQSQVGPEAQFGPFVDQGLGFNETTVASAATTN
jgi:hypothetical protein